jgi:hypothetical protein
MTVRCIEAGAHACHHLRQEPEGTQPSLGALTLSTQLSAAAATHQLVLCLPFHPFCTAKKPLLLRIPLPYTGYTQQISR